MEEEDERFETDSALEVESSSPANRAALYSCPSADITPSHPVSRKHASISDGKSMFPLAKTGTETACFTARILSQSASPCKMHNQ